MLQKLYDWINSDGFNIVINVIIAVNAILIGIETQYNNETITFIQQSCLAIFTAEIFLRFAASKTARHYFIEPWNWFDIFVVGVCYIPENLVANGAAISVLRILRILRILRLLKTNQELKIITTVLIRSTKSLGNTLLVVLIFMYMYAVMGVILFKGGPGANGTVISGQNPDPYGSVGEAFFSLLRIMTGEDWTDLRYNLLGSNLSGVHDTIVTIYHVSWIILAAFLLLNLVVGAIVSNYEQVSCETKGIKKAENEMLNIKLDLLQDQLKALSQQIKNVTKEDSLVK